MANPLTIKIMDNISKKNLGKTINKKVDNIETDKSNIIENINTKQDEMLKSILYKNKKVSSTAENKENRSKKMISLKDLAK